MKNRQFIEELQRHSIESLERTKRQKEIIKRATELCPERGGRNWGKALDQANLEMMKRRNLIN